MVGTLLTVVVPTIPGRESLLSRCLWSITTQAPGSVEVLVLAGAGKLGDKANLAATVAKGSHLVVVDDDDYLAANFFDLVLPHVVADVDYVGYRVLQLDHGSYMGSAVTRGDTHVFEQIDHGPTPKGVCRTSLWRQVPMRNDYFGDRHWCREMAPLISSHAFIDRDLYVYDYWPRASAFVGNELTRHVGEWPFDESRIRRLEVA